MKDENLITKIILTAAVFLLAMVVLNIVVTEQNRQIEKACYDCPDCYFDQGDLIVNCSYYNDSCLYPTPIYNTM